MDSQWSGGRGESNYLARLTLHIVSFSFLFLAHCFRLLPWFRWHIICTKVCGVCLSVQSLHGSSLKRIGNVFRGSFLHRSYVLAPIKIDLVAKRRVHVICDKCRTSCSLWLIKMNDIVYIAPDLLFPYIIPALSWTTVLYSWSVSRRYTIIYSSHWTNERLFRTWRAICRMQRQGSRSLWLSNPQPPW